MLRRLSLLKVRTMPDPGPASLRLKSAATESPH